MAQRPVLKSIRLCGMRKGSGPIVPSGLTPLGIGAGVPMTTLFGAVNQNETDSPGVKPVAVKVMTVPAVPVVGTAVPLTVPVISQSAAAACTQAKLSSRANNPARSRVLIDIYLPPRCY